MTLTSAGESHSQERNFDPFHSIFFQALLPVPWLTSSLFGKVGHTGNTFLSNPSYTDLRVKRCQCFATQVIQASEGDLRRYLQLGRD